MVERKYREHQWKTPNRILAFITEFTRVNGYSPSIREIRDAVGVKSTSTVFRHISDLEREGLIVSRKQKARSLAAAQDCRTSDEREIVLKRVCIDTADGGRVYLDCRLEKPKAVPVEVSFNGILDAKELKCRVARIVACRMEEEQGIT